MLKYLTIKDYIRTVVIFIPIFFLVGVITAGMTGNKEVSNWILILPLIASQLLLFLILILIAFKRKKQHKMV